ncbi:hypothetical protein Bcer98_2359 [Bacillus cytotoxicus NVH 391-98]|uniref:Uncharacterized protein n=2 Tax=Bacillus TaxID=1386 RepID=A7GR46_BACCN|nr:hypothetical protein Bcer98_2359 [Bacillus cytotoxicus NVH 391-98]SCN39081.1 Uncharacterized protein BC88300_02840 [Bacillus cytotoxicus]
MFGIGLSVLLIAFLFLQVYPFHEQKLEQRNYDEYEIWLIIWTWVCLYVSHHFLQENTWQWVVKIIGATFFTDFSIGCVGKQSIYDFQHKKFPFQKNDVSDSFVIES